MTLDTTLSKVLYQGNGSATQFPFAFKVWEPGQIRVTVTGPGRESRDVTAQSQVELTEDGGVVTYPLAGEALSDEYSLSVTRNMPFTQDIDLVSGSRFDAKVMEIGMDQSAAERQQLLEQLGRAVILPPTSEKSPEEVVEDIYAARDEAQQAANEARECRHESCECANVARDAAERAENALTLSSGKNIETTWILEAAISAGDTLTIPENFTYLVGRNALRLSWGVAAMYHGSQFVEVGDKDSLSSTVIILINVPKGAQLNAWSISPALSKTQQEQIESVISSVDTCREQASISIASANEATAQADRAEKAASNIAWDGDIVEIFNDALEG